jgi:hypothetical protein
MHGQYLLMSFMRKSEYAPSVSEVTNKQHTCFGALQVLFSGI